MTGLVEVFSAWFRTFGYATESDAVLEGTSGSHHQVPLLVERDARRVGVYTWLHPDAPSQAFFGAIRTAREDVGIDQVLILSLGTVTEAEHATLLGEEIHVWDGRRIVQELGEAVLAETCPDVWPAEDPLRALEASRIRDNVYRHAFATPPVTVPAPPPMDPQTEPPFPAAAPALATPDQQPPTAFELPPAFGALDAVLQAPGPAPAPLAAAPQPLKPQRAILKSQVSRALALSLVKKRLRAVDKVLLRLVPFHVFDFEANLLVEGRLDAETRRGRMAVDAAMKKVLDWVHPLETGTLPADAVEIDEKRVRVEEHEAGNLLRQELVKVVTRDVVMEEDADEWSVVVKKRVTLAPNDIQLTSQGLYWVPVWRLSGKDGSVEIDASAGTVLHEDILVNKSDAQLI